MTTEKMHINLDGEWSLLYFPEGSHKIDHPDGLDLVNKKPLRACVPGNVEIDLLNAGLITEPFVGSNFQNLRQFEGYEWWFSRSFNLPEPLPEDGFKLIISGLDTIGSIWINGIFLGSVENMLVEHEFLVENLVGGENLITIRIGSVTNQALHQSYEPSMMSWENREEGLYIRKAPHVWGWDIMPRIVSAGIWRSIWLESILDTGIDSLYFWTEDVSPKGANVGMWFQFHTPDADFTGYNLMIYGICGDHQFHHNWPVEFISGRCVFHVNGAQLWWPKGYGEPNLYTVTVQLRCYDRVLAEKVEIIGIRKVEIRRSVTAGFPWKPELPLDIPGRVDRDPDPEGHFLIIVNHLPILVKGTNWVPLDAFHSRDRERLPIAMALVADLGCNMIRCWGGNVYEDHEFFDNCDRHGIMVWQDFSFACCRYPQTDPFLGKVRREAEYIVHKLRNHPSLTLWCGDNEIDMTYLAEGLSPEENRISREILPQVVHRLDPHRAYIPSSPHAPPAAIKDSDVWTGLPEQHLWGPRGYFKSPFYADHRAHFIGEIGYHGCPHISSIQRFITPENIWPWRDNPEWQSHSVYHWLHDAIDRDRIQLMANQIRELFGMIPDNLPEFVLASQISQAEAKKFFIESTRYRKWRTSGILWWNLLDGWPQFSDAIVDYYFKKKLAYHYIRRVQQPHCIFLGDPGSGKYLPVIMSNDSNQSELITYRIWDADTGEVVSEESATCPANENWQVDQIRTYTSEKRIFLIEWVIGNGHFGNHYLVGSPPISFEWYRSSLRKIAELPNPFDVQDYVGG